MKFQQQQDRSAGHLLNGVMHDMSVTGPGSSRVTARRPLGVDSEEGLQAEHPGNDQFDHKNRWEGPGSVVSDSLVKLRVVGLNKQH